MKHTDLVVEAFDKTQRHFVFRLAIGSNPIPMGIDHLGKFLVRFQALPLELIAPVLEELSRPGFPGVAPKLAERLLQHVRDIKSLVGSKQYPKVF